MWVSKNKQANGSFEISFVKLRYWEDFDLILELLEKENGCEIIRVRDMVYARDSIIKKGNMEFILNNDSVLGNYITTTKPEDVDTLYQIAVNVLESIKLKYGDE